MEEEKKNKEKVATKKITLGGDFYNALKRNNIAVYAISAVALFVSLGAIFLAYSLSVNYQKTLFAIDSKGEIIPLRLIEKQESREIEIKANLDRFVDLYFELDGLSMKAKREKLLWLLGTKATKTMEDKINKGYFNEFLNIAGLRQRAYILGNTLQVTKKEPYKARFTVRIQRINANVSNYYNCDIECQLIETSQNYPLNPFGLLITDFTERLYQIDINEDIYRKQAEEAEAEFNQNTLQSNEHQSN